MKFIYKLIIVCFCLGVFSSCSIRETEPLNELSEAMLTPEYWYPPLPNNEYRLLRWDEINLPQREQLFEDSLALWIEIISVQYDQNTNPYSPVVIKLQVSFENLTEESIMIRRPLPISIYSELTNTQLVVLEPGGNIADFIPDSFDQIVLEPPVSETENDFLIIEAGEFFTELHELRLPGRFRDMRLAIEGEESDHLFLLGIQYLNEHVGYKIEFRDWLPEEVAQSISATINPDNQCEDCLVEWAKNNTLYTDMNAWVGLLKSNQVWVVIPGIFYDD